MPARTDHDRRDAQHAARATIAIAMGRYIRRVTEEAYAKIEQEAAEYDGSEPVNWSAVGAAAANQSLASYGAGSSLERAIEAEHVALEVGGGSTEFT